ncbi:MAG TPA: hypothetical protein VEF04_14720, partial [Blastocatellia bacterium]|nr:hypothetical protein [Blastocatellia bacterium]
MPTRKLHLKRLRIGLMLLCFSFAAIFIWSNKIEAVYQRATSSAKSLPFKTTMQFSSAWEKRLELKQGEVFEIAVSLPSPSLLPTHGRVGVRWRLVQASGSDSLAETTIKRAADAFGIYTKPTADWQKTLHALDADLYQVYRAPVSGTYALEIAPITDETPIFDGPRWREEGVAPNVTKFPKLTPWPANKAVPLTASINQLDLRDSKETGMFVEQEPNDTPEQAQTIEFNDKQDADGVQVLRVSGSADDIEYFDNGKVGQSGDDWFKLVYNGAETKLLTLDLAIPDHTLAAQLRFYALDNSGQLVEYTEGRNENERTHQQNEGHRAAIVRLLEPGRTYFVRTEANAPGYEVELR